VQRGLTQKAQAIADERKANEEALATAKFIQENPDKALEILAEKRGRRIAPREEEAKKEEAVDEIFDKWKGALGGEEQAKQFYPLLKESFESFFQSQIVPLQKQQEEITRNAQAAEYQAGVAKFGASVVEKGGEWNNEVQDKMTEKMNYIAPADKATLDQYLKVLHDSVLQDELEATTKQKAVTRLRNAEKKDEPTKASRTAKADARQVTVEMDLDEALDLAVKQAQAEAE
jgi:hypothetical protein